MAVYGADVEQLRAMAQQFARSADRLEAELAGMLGREIASSPWKGMDADSFRHEWQASLSPKLRSVAAALRTASETLKRNAQEQEQTSQADGVGISGSWGSKQSRHEVRDQDRVTKIGLLQLISDATDSTKHLELTRNIINALKMDTNIGRSGRLGQLLDRLNKSGKYGKAIQGIGIINSANDLNNFHAAIRSGSSYEKFSTGVDAAGGLLQQAPFGSYSYILGTGAKAAKLIGEEAGKAVMGGGWPKGVSVSDTLISYTGTKPSKNPVVKAMQTGMGGAIAFGKAAWSVIGKVF